MGIFKNSVLLTVFTGYIFVTFKPISGGKIFLLCILPLLGVSRTISNENDRFCKVFRFFRSSLVLNADLTIFCQTEVSSRQYYINSSLCILFEKLQGEKSPKRLSNFRTEFDSVFEKSCEIMKLKKNENLYQKILRTTIAACSKRKEIFSIILL